MTQRTLNVSIIIPAYNAGEFIAETLESLIAQSVPSWEAIVVDDGSSDETVSLANSFAERDPRFHTLNQTHQGVSAARNRGIHQARYDWLLFLDADDWILPDFLDKLTKLLLDDPELDAAYCAYVRVYPDGSNLAGGYLSASRDMFPVLTRYCAFPIHSCIVRRSLVERVGGFDSSLVTCEDWDLWQRIARAGARFSSINEVLAYYRIRPTSASMQGLQMLRDGLQVIQRGHSTDSRVPGAHPAWVAGVPVESLAKDQLHYACWPVGLAIGREQDPLVLLNELQDVQEPGLDPQTITNLLFLSILLPDCRKQADWPSLWAKWQSEIQIFLQAFEKQSLAPQLARRVTLALERLILGNATLIEPVTLELTGGIRVEIAQPIADLTFPKEVERTYCKIEMEGEFLGAIELPVLDGVVSSYVLADAIAAEYAWIILGRFFYHTVYRGLSFEMRPTGLAVLRGNFVLAEGLPRDIEGNWPWLHDQIGWLVFMQEIWSRPTWGNQNFYEARSSEATTSTHQLDQESVWVEITDELVDLQTASNTLQVFYTLGGTALGGIERSVPDAFLRAAELRVEINNASGFELCRAAVREGILGKPFVGADSLHTRLAEAAKTNSHLQSSVAKPLSALYFSEKNIAQLGVNLNEGKSALMMGRHVPSVIGSSHSRRASLPADAASELIELAGTVGQMVLQLPAEGQPPNRVVYAPEFTAHPDQSLADLPVKKHRSKDVLSDQGYRRDHFETIFAANDDPWKYTSDYERVKYEQTIGLLPNQPYLNALEIGCAEGHFTAMLAPRVKQLTAADISEIALKRASERCAGFSNVHYIQLDLTQDALQGPFDAIVCSEILYYVGDRKALKTVIQKIANALKPGGYFLTAHAHLVIDEPDQPGFDWNLPFGAKSISDEITNNRLFSLKKEIRTPLYRTQLFQRQHPLSFTKLLNRPQIEKLEKQPTSLLPDVASHVLWQGTNARSDYQAELVTTKRLPILMYHRVASTGSPGLSAYRVIPEAFGEQLHYLSEAGYYSITLDEWRTARELRRPISGKPIILTFDDGYTDFKEFAWPLLQRYDFSATVFLVADQVGKFNHWDAFYGETLPLMDWPDILSLQKEGIEFGSHTATHPHLNGLSHSEIVKEVVTSRRVLQEKLGNPIHSIAYPHGSTDKVVQHLVGACGYLYGLTINSRRCEFNDSLLALPRIDISGSDDLQRFIQKLQP